VTNSASEEGDLSDDSEEEASNQSINSRQNQKHSRDRNPSSEVEKTNTPTLAAKKSMEKS